MLGILSRKKEGEIGSNPVESIFDISIDIFVEWESQ